MLKTKIFIVLLALMSLLMAETPRKYITSRTMNPPQIDGRLDDLAWETIPMEGNFRMHQPHDDTLATFQTEFAVIYDNSNIYIAVRAYDPEPEKINKQILRRDNIESEFVAVCIDSYHDKTTAVCFFLTPSGVQGDIFFSKDGEVGDESWNALWWGKTQIDDQGWTAEFRIPLSQLRFVEKEDQIWGFDVMRDVHRSDEESFWTEHKKSTSGFIHDFGELHGLHNIKARKVRHIMPYAVSQLKTYEAEADNPYMHGTDMKVNGGIDGKIGLSNNFTLDFTLNPDFGQVEADPATVNLSAFETFFSERRPFFIEGSNITSFPLDVNGSSEQLFHSRRIGRQPHYYPDTEDNEYSKTPTSTDILAAAKVTGRTEKGLNIGVVEAITQKEYTLITDGDNERKVLSEPLSNYTVAAFKQDLHDGKMHLGAIITALNRHLEEEHLNDLHDQAYTTGLDLRYYGKDHLWQIDARGFGSYVHGSSEAISKTQESSSHLYQRPDAPWVHYDSTRTSLSGHGGSIRIGKFGGTYRAALKVNWKSPGLELNDIGFIGQTDIIAQNIWLNYRKTSPFWIFNWIESSIVQWNNYNFGGLHQNSGASIQFNSRFKNRVGFDLGLEHNSDYLSSTALRGGPRLRQPGSNFIWTWLGSDYTKDVEVWGFFISGVNPEGHFHRQQVESEIEWKINHFVDISFFAEWAREHNDLQYVTQVDFYDEERYILSRFHQENYSFQLGLDINITPNMSLEYRGRPYFVSGKYDEFKVVVDGDNELYHERFDQFTHNIKLNGDTYICDEDRSGTWDYSFDDPNFIYSSFQSNLVFRWEYSPGSTLYLVWSLNNELNSDEERVVLPDNIRALNKEIPENVILIKISYLLGN